MIHSEEASDSAKFEATVFSLLDVFVIFITPFAIFLKERQIFACECGKTPDRPPLSD
jgi:hypothetical protein